MCKLLISNCLRNSHTKKHRNWLIFDKVIGKIKGGPFFVDTVYLHVCGCLYVVVSMSHLTAGSDLVKSISCQCIRTLTHHQLMFRHRFHYIQNFTLTAIVVKN